MVGKYQAYSEYIKSGEEWLGVVPASWVLMQAKHCFLLQRGHDLSSDKMIDGAFPVYGSNGVIGKHNMFTTKAPSVTVGRSGSVGEVNYVQENYWAHNTALYLKEFKGSPPRFLYYLLLALSPKRLSAGSAVGTLDRNNIHSQLVALPSQSERETIANFLDHETAKIDTLIDKQQQLIKLLKEKRQAVISHAVTKGLDPAAPMKDSGVEWLGEVPEHWDVAGFKKYLESIVDYRGKTPNKVDDGVFLVTARNIKNGVINYDLSHEYISEEDYSEVMSRGVPEIGDVLFTTEAPMGEVANVDKTDIALAQRVIKFRGASGVLDNYYLKHFIQSESFQNSLMLFASGSTALGIKAERLVYLRQLIPPLDEQKEIVEWISVQVHKYDEIIDRSIQGIGLLKERRTALISATVTGKIDVRNWQPAG